MQSDTLMLYKLIILNMLARVKFPLSNSQLSEFILLNEYTGYLNCQQIITELLDDNYIFEQAGGKTTTYTITSLGRETVAMFKNDISAALIKDIEEYLKKNKYELHNELALPADYTKNPAGDYTIHLKINENNFSLADLKLIVPTEKQAIAMCNSWRSKSADIYSNIIYSLSSSDEA